MAAAKLRGLGNQRSQRALGILSFTLTLKSRTVSGVSVVLLSDLALQNFRLVPTP